MKAAAVLWPVHPTPHAVCRSYAYAAYKPVSSVYSWLKACCTWIACAMYVTCIWVVFWRNVSVLQYLCMIEYGFLMGRA